MPTLKKVRLVIDEYLVNEREAIDALAILDLGLKLFFKEDRTIFNNQMKAFQNTYHHSHLDTLNKIREWHPTINEDIKIASPKAVYDNYKTRYLSRFDKEPARIIVDGEYQWVFKGYIYEVKGIYSDEQIRLLILGEFDKERRYFEKLKAKFDETQASESTYERPRIPEGVRIEVWWRDGGKCARCGSREKLEYDHIVPISKGGSSTARNIELLCEKHNRSKSNNVV